MTTENQICWERWGREAADKATAIPLVNLARPDARIARTILEHCKIEEHLQLHFASELEAVRWALGPGPAANNGEADALRELVSAFRARLTEISEDRP